MGGTISNAVEALLVARKTGMLIDGLPSGSEPQSIAEAYAIQDEVSKVLSPIIGWKVAPSRSGPEVLTGPLYQETFIAESSLSIAGLKNPYLECEIAFRVGHQITSNTPESELLDKLQVVPLFEISHTRFTDVFKVPPLSLLADSYAAGFIKVGSPVDCWRDLPAVRQQFRITVDGKLIEEFNYADKLKAALELAIAVVRNKDGRSRSLPLGTVITTGSISKPSILSGEVVADYGPLGVNRLMLHA